MCSYKLLSLCLLHLILVLFAGCGICRVFAPISPAPTLSPEKQQTHEQIDVADQFLQELLAGDEESAASRLSSRMRSAVNEHCGGRVIDCLNARGIEAGDKIAHYLFEAARPGDEKGAVRFLIVWEDLTYAYVGVLVVHEDDMWVVDGWRGWVENPDGLLSEDYQVNVFPPPD